MTTTNTIPKMKHEYKIVTPDIVHINDWNPSHRSNPETPEAKELRESLKESGQLQAVGVILHPTINDHYLVIFGCRRTSCIKAENINAIEIKVFHDISLEEAKTTTIVENLQREDLTDIEMAFEIEKLFKEEFSILEISDKTGKSPTWIARHKNLVNLSPKWLKELRNEKSELYGFNTSKLILISRHIHEIQDDVLNKKWARNLPHDKLEKELLATTRNMSGAPWDLEEEGLSEKKIACINCTQRSACQSGLWSEFGLDDKKESKLDKCLDEQCWDEKLKTYLEIEMTIAMGVYGDSLRFIDSSSVYIDQDTIRPHQYTKTTKSDKESFPVINVTDQGLDKRASYYKLNQTNHNGNASPENEKKKPKTLKERRLGLESRRKRFVMEKVGRLVSASNFDDIKISKEDLPFFLLSLSNKFGADFQNNYPRKDTWEKLDKDSKDKNMQDSWNTSKRIFMKRIKYPNTAEPEYWEVKHMAKIIGLDLKPLEETAQKVIPEPKSWANLKADGTPKVR